MGPSRAMKTLIFKKRNMFSSESQFFSVFVLVVLGLLSRFAPHPPNFTALGALALTGGFFLRPRLLKYGVPLLVLFLSDCVLGFHNTMVSVYLGFVGASFLGQKLSASVDSSSQRLSGTSFGRLLMGSCISTVFFFLLTNFSVWLQGELYPKTGLGLLASYVAGVPFLENQVLGDLFWTTILSASMASVPFLNRLFVAKSSQQNHI